MRKQEQSPHAKSYAPIKSRYADKEYVYDEGFESVWGSFYDVRESKWGYACCKSTERYKKKEGE